MKEYRYKFTYDNLRFTEVDHCPEPIDFEKTLEKRFLRIVTKNGNIVINLDKVVTVEEWEEEK